MEANVATGYHAIEFLLWGQDLNGTGAGAGGVVAIDALSNATRPVAADFLEAGKWDNHLVAAVEESGRKPGKQWGIISDSARIGVDDSGTIY